VIGPLLVWAAGAVAAEGSALDEAQRALADVRPEEAVAILERARGEGPYDYRDHARLYEQLGTAYAYLERSADALEAFDLLLAIDPARAISYTLSPKVTFLFEQARNKAAARTPPTVQVSWASNLKVGEEVPIDVEVVADPRVFLRKATLFHRQRGTPQWSSVSLALPPPGERVSLNLPPVIAAGPDGIELYLVAQDASGNEVLRWAGPERPREVALAFDPPTPWYGRWWVWTIAGGVVAAGAAAAALAVTHEPGATVDTTFQVQR
jgi:hypothetical protein